MEDNKPFNPPEGLMEFIKKAHDDGKAVVYIGFGSITVPDSAAVTKAVVQAVKNADVRAILSKGKSLTSWRGRIADNEGRLERARRQDPCY